MDQLGALLVALIITSSIAAAAPVSPLPHNRKLKQLHEHAGAGNSSRDGTRLGRGKSFSPLKLSVSHVFDAHSPFRPTLCNDSCASQLRVKRFVEARKARRERLSALAAVNQLATKRTGNGTHHATPGSKRRRGLLSIPWGVVNTNYFNGGQVSEYYVELSIGQESQVVYMSIDTGSDLAWVQTLPCQQCYPQKLPYFDYRASTALQMINQDDPYCQDLQGTPLGAGSDASLCLYNASYADGTGSYGFIATDDFNFWDAGAGPDVSVTMEEIAFGCGTRNQAGIQTDTSGVIGLGHGRGLSIPERLDVLGEQSSVFSFCFAPIFSPANTGFLTFGDGALPGPDFLTTPFLNEGFVVYFYVELIDFVINGQRVNIPNGLATINNDGTGGVIVDSGDIISIIDPAAYGPFRAAWLNAVANIVGGPGAPGPDGLDTCWDYPNPVALPPIGFLFNNGNILTLTPDGTQFVFQDDNGVQRMCWPFLQKNPDDTFANMVIGAVSLHGVEAVFDTSNNNFAWKTGVCLPS